MALYLVSENIDKARSHYLADTGKIVQLMRGIYVDSDDNIETVVQKHSIRIAKYLYPRAYLAAASAILLRPTNDGKLYISGPRSQRTRIRNLEIIQNIAPKSPSLATAIIDDGQGEFTVEVSSIRQRLLEAFRTRSEHAASIDTNMRVMLANRVIEEYGSPEKAADAMWALARQNEWYKEGEQVERYLRNNIEVEPIRNEAEIKLIVAWHRNPIGTLSHDGFEWRWIPAEGNNLPLIRQTVPGKLPPFISSLLPEGWLENVLKDEDERAALRSGKRYMSNIAIVDNQTEIARLPADTLEVPLKQYSKNGVFTGEYAGPGKDEINESFEKNLAEIYARADTPRLSGVQIKAPMYLNASGILYPSINLPFTHILKPGGTSGFEFVPIIEWLSLSLGRQVGFDVPDFALVNMPNDMPPALLVERFDIRQSPNDHRKMALEDFCSLLDLSAADKYKGTIEQASKALRGISTQPDQDVLILIKRALFAWLIADGDMHLKNLAVLKIAVPSENMFHYVRMAPLYDAVTTVVFPGLKHDLMALKMNAKANRIKRKDFMQVAATAGIKASYADAMIDDTVSKLELAIEQIKLPNEIGYNKAAKSIADEMIEICHARLREFKKRS
jgi:serine/threonine-protein kinase HipA